MWFMVVKAPYDQIKGRIYSSRCFLVRHNVATDLSTVIPTGDRFANVRHLNAKEPRLSV